MDKEQQVNVPELVMELDKPRRLSFDLNALTEWEETFEVDFNQIDTVLTSMKKFRTSIWIFLKHGHENPEQFDLTEAQVGRMITPHVLGKFNALLLTAFPAVPQPPKNRGR